MLWRRVLLAWAFCVLWTSPVWAPDVGAPITYTNGQIGFEGFGTIIDGRLCQGGAASTLDCDVVNTKVGLEGALSDSPDLALASGDTYSGTHDFSGATMRVPDGGAGAALSCGTGTEGQIQVRDSDSLQWCDSGSPPALVRAAWGGAGGVAISSSLALDLTCSPGCVSLSELADPAVSADQVLYWDEGTTSWVVRNPTSDFTEDGTNFLLHTDVTEMGPTIGDETDEIYNHATSITLSNKGTVGIDNDDNVLKFYGNQENSLYPERQSFVVGTMLWSGTSTTFAVSAPRFSGFFPPGMLADFASPTTEANRYSIAPIAMQCDELAVCKVYTALASDETLDVTVRSGSGGSLTDTTLTCTLDGSVTASSCSGADNAWGCSTSLTTPISISQYDQVTVAGECITGCPTAVNQWMYITARCWSNE